MKGIQNIAECLKGAWSIKLDVKTIRYKKQALYLILACNMYSYISSHTNFYYIKHP